MKKSKSIIPENSLFFSRTKDFLDRYLIEQCSKSQKTSDSYRDALSIFRRFLTYEKNISIADFTFDQLTRDLLTDYTAFLKKNYTDKTVNHRLAAIKSYVWYCADEDIKLQPLAFMVSRVPFVKEAKIIRPTLTEEMISAMLQAPKKGKFKDRDRLILIILYDTAIRLEELIELTLGSLHLEPGNSYLIIHGKGDKERFVAVQERTEKHLENYLKNFYSLDKQDLESPLFYTVRSGTAAPMSPSNIERIVKKYADAIRDDYPDMPETVYPHMLRRTRATHLYQEGIQLELVGRILGHASIETTKIYATPSMEMLRDAMETTFDAEDEYAEWEDAEEIMARKFGLR